MDSPSGRALAAKCRKLPPDEAARELLRLYEDGRRGLVLEIILLLDKMPIDYFDAILDYDQRLGELYWSAE